MKKYLPIFYIVLRFLGLYLLLFMAYQLYLNYYHNICQTNDIFTDWVACQAKMILELLGVKTDLIQVYGKPYVWIFFHEKYVARVTEGCNALAVMIFFTSFVFGFYKGFNKTVLYVLLGWVILHSSNVVRVAFIAWIYYRYPAYNILIHDYIFPTIIYGVVMLLWLYWVKYQVLKK